MVVAILPHVFGASAFVAAYGLSVCRCTETV